VQNISEGQIKCLTIKTNKTVSTVTLVTDRVLKQIHSVFLNYFNNLITAKMSFTLIYSNLY